MTGNHTRGASLADFRFAGYTDLELADVVDELGHGPGAGAMTAAANNLHDVAGSLQTINETLSTQLGAIGVHWQSKRAAGAAHHTLGGSRNYARDAHGQVAISATSIDENGEAYRFARGGLPDSGALRDSGYAGSHGFTGNEIDHTEVVRRKEAARHQAIDALDGYSRSAAQHVDRHETLPPVQHVVHHEPAPSHEQTPSYGGTSPAASLPPAPTAPSGGAPAPVTGGAPAGGAPVNQAPVVGSGPLPGTAPVTGGTGPAPSGPGVGPAPGVYPAPIGRPGSGGGSIGSGQPGGYAGARLPGGSAGVPTGGGVPGSGGAVGGGVVPAPGARMGAGAVAAESQLGGVAGAANAARGAGMGAMANGAMNAVAGGASGAGAAAAGAQNGDRVVRGRPGGTPMSREGALSGVEPEGSSASRAASRVGSGGARSRSMMEPAAGTSRQEEDGSHVRRYGVEAEDLFSDGRMVANPVLGDEPE